MDTQLCKLHDAWCVINGQPLRDMCSTAPCFLPQEYIGLLVVPGGEAVFCSFFFYLLRILGYDTGGVETRRILDFGPSPVGSIEQSARAPRCARSS